MISNIEQRLVRLRNELKALKIARELVYSQILDEPGKEATASGEFHFRYFVDTNGVSDHYFDRHLELRARFTRSDGKAEAPMVDFGFRLHITKQNGDALSSSYVSAAVDEYAGCLTQIYGNISATGTTEAGNGYTDYQIVVSGAFATYFSEVESTTGSGMNMRGDFKYEARVQAVSMVKGVLNLEKVYERS